MAQEDRLKKIIDLRSDKATVAPQQMLKAMSEAQVGDDVYDDDPDANRLQQFAAKYFGFQSSLIIPSTTMANLITVLLWTKPGDQVIVWGNSHLVERESAGLALIGGVQTRQILSETGILNIKQIQKRTRKASEHITYPSTTLIFIQNCTFTGEVWPLETLAQLKAFSEEKDVKLAIDGSRIINAVHHYGVSPSQISKYCDSMTMCLSKGLCCPFGSLLFGTHETIKRAKHLRKSLGGGLRQTGIIGAAGLYAFQHIAPKMKEDNLNAIYLAGLLNQIPQIHIDCSKVQANIVNFKIKNENFDHEKYVNFLLDEGIKIKKFNEQRDHFRVVIHQRIGKQELNRFIQLTKQHIKNEVKLV